MGTIIIVLLVILMFFFVLKDPVWGFWISLALYFDPGGLFQGYFQSNIIGQINFYDIWILFMSIAFLIRQRFHKVVYDRNFIQFVKYYAFVFVYYVLVFGYLVPASNGEFTFKLFLIKQREILWGFLILFYVYYFVQNSLLNHYYITVLSGFIILSLFILGLLFKFSVIPSVTFIRYRGEGMLRIGMLSYGLFQAVLPILLALIILRKSFKTRIFLRRELFVAGILLVIVYLITLTRRTFINLGAEIIVVIWVSQIISGARINLTKPILFILVILTALYLMFPAYIGYSKNIYQDTILLITTGKDSRGQSDYRISGEGDLAIVKDYIKEKPWFGQGFYWMSWDEKIRRANFGDRFAKAWDAAQEVPIYYLFFSKGIVGFIIYTPVYILLLLSIKDLFRRVKRHYYQIARSNPYVVLFALTILSGFVLDFSVGIYALYGDIGTPNFMVKSGLLFGLNALIVKEYYSG